MSVRIFLSGCNGRMGKTIRAIAAEQDGLSIVAGSDIQTDPACPFPIYQEPQMCQEDFDVLIDFSNPAAFNHVCQLIEKCHCPAVICTTGLEQDMKDRLLDLSKASPIFMSANMSLGINLLIGLARQAAALLYPEYNIEIIEAHHNQKVDAPSGTALMIAEQINDALSGQLNLVTDRSQTRNKRDPAELGIHAIRGGNIVGEHTVLFAGPEENITIHHSAQSRAVFARGALAAARFLTGKPAGFYSMTDLIAERKP
ncbi:MAG: 4-hydroxy-tetrahydrodipicolinate reductase [Bacillota bacterium]|nr:4-hydroxy-tetrahydrodipicolinate reductase [Bacillota bacterium]